MMYKTPLLSALFGLALASSGCSEDRQPSDNTVVNAVAPGSVENAPATATKGPVPSPTADGTNESANASSLPEAPSGASVGSDILSLEGFGGLVVSEPVPRNSSWAERGAQTGGSCRLVSSPRHPGAYAIVLDGKVQRITLGQRSRAKLAEGIGVGASETDVKKWFAGFREEPHKYEDAPAKYLTAPNAARGSSALRFEFGGDGRVKMIHVGLMPVLAYVEGCA